MTTSATNAMVNRTDIPIISMKRHYLNEKHLWHSKLRAECAECSNEFNVFLQVCGQCSGVWCA